MTAAPLEFGPKRLPIWMARIFGGSACLTGVSMLRLAAANRHDFLLTGLFLIFGLCAAVFGVWMLVRAARMARLHAVFTLDALQVVAPHWFDRRLTPARIPWSALEGFTELRILNPSWPRGVETTCILYTSFGDFRFDDCYWKNLGEFRREIAARLGRAASRSGPEQSAAQAGFQSSLSRLHSLERRLGWAVAAVSAPLFVLAAAGGVLYGFSDDLGRGMLFLFFAFSLGVSMVRFYRRNAGFPVRRRP